MLIAAAPLVTSPSLQPASPSIERPQGEAPSDSTEALPETGVPLLVEADSIDASEAGAIMASGHVHASYEGMELHADSIRFDRGTLRGEASGSIRLDRDLYHLRARQLRFDLNAVTADATDWQALIDRQGWFGGARLHLAREQFYSEDARVSPCVHEDPGYWLAADRFEWYPQRTSWNLRGRYVQVVVGGTPILWIPFFAATIGEQARKTKLKLPEAQTDATVGLDGAQGMYVDSQLKYNLGPMRPGSVPIRVMSSRGISAGVVQDFPTRWAQGRFETNYTQYFPWLSSGSVDAGRSGLHSNLALIHDWSAGARSILNVGYRVDVGHRSDIQYQVDPGGTPIHRLPELVTTWPARSFGPLTLSPSTRAGYLVEDLTGNAAGLLQTSVGLGLPGWHPNGFWESGFYGGANASYYFADRSQSVLSLGVSNVQHWAPWLTTSFNFESQPVLTTGIGTPFSHDRATAVDRFLFGANLHVFGPWSIGGGGFYARDWKDPVALSSFNLGDMYFNLKYTVNCLSYGITFRPPRSGQPFQYFFDFNVITF